MNDPAHVPYSPISENGGNGLINENATSSIIGSITINGTSIHNDIKHAWENDNVEKGVASNMLGT